MQVFVHSKGSDWSGLHQHVAKDVLPPEYGGTYHNTIDELRGTNTLRVSVYYYNRMNKVMIANKKRAKTTNDI